MVAMFISMKAALASALKHGKRNLTLPPPHRRQRHEVIAALCVFVDPVNDGRFTGQVWPVLDPIEGISRLNATPAQSRCAFLSALAGGEALLCT